MAGHKLINPSDDPNADLGFCWASALVVSLDLEVDPLHHSEHRH